MIKSLKQAATSSITVPLQYDRTNWEEQEYRNHTLWRSIHQCTSNCGVSLQYNSRTLCQGSNPSWKSPHFIQSRHHQHQWSASCVLEWRVPYHHQPLYWLHWRKWSCGSGTKSSRGGCGSWAIDTKVLQHHYYGQSQHFPPLGVLD